MSHNVTPRERRPMAAVQYSAKKNEHFGTDPWSVAEKSPGMNFRPGETVFSTGNGFIGQRGIIEDYQQMTGSSVSGSTYLNGIFEQETYHYPESAYGFAKCNQIMVPVPEGRLTEIKFDDEILNIAGDSITDYNRKLCFRSGVVTTEFIRESARGTRVKILIRRMTCLQHPNLALIDYQITPLNNSVRITITSYLQENFGSNSEPLTDFHGSQPGKDQTTIANNGWNKEIKNKEINSLTGADDPRVCKSPVSGGLVLIKAWFSGKTALMLHRTANSGQEVVSGIAGTYSFDGSDGVIADDETYCSCPLQNALKIEKELSAGPGQIINFTKYITYHATDVPDNTDRLAKDAASTLQQAVDTGFDRLAEEQKLFLERFWQAADVIIEGDEPIQQGIRFNIFHLLQATGNDGRTGISAKGLSGEGYGGHYFWESEVYISPVFLYTWPDYSRMLLLYRYHTLPKARARARELSFSKGALFAWRTIDGEECSPYFPAGTAQYHINSAVFHALQKYMEATGDMDFLLEKGAELLFETAGIWIELGHYRRDGQFCIDGVTGPDEYTALVNNNFYTNCMARAHLNYAFEIAGLLKEKYSSHYHRLVKETGLTATEVLSWQQAAASMYMPYDRELGIFPQDDTFLNKKKWDFSGTPPEKYPLLLHYHPLDIYRCQVIKQADVLLALFLRDAEFSPEDIRKNYDYYEPLTTHDSSLSAVIYSIMAAAAGYEDEAIRFYAQTCRADLDDLHGNTANGIHAAAMAGAWLGAVYGFAGMRTGGGRLSFTPQLPRTWQSLQFRILYRGCRLQIKLTREQVTYTLTAGDELFFYHYDKGLVIKKDQIITI